MVLEHVLTLAVAMRLKRKLKYDIIQMREGEPFLPAPFLLSLPFRDYNWVVLVGGGNLFYTPPPLFTILRKQPRLFVYAIALKVLNSKLWRPLYRASMARNRFLFLAGNEAVKQSYDSYMQGVFSGKVVYIRPALGGMVRRGSKEDARQRLGLPDDKPLFLSFGVPHPGKDFLTVFRALKHVPDVLLLQAGRTAFSVGANPAKLAKTDAALDRVIIRDYYIPEEEKPYYFRAADAVILSYTKQYLGPAGILWEACHSGTPVIASDAGELGELVRAFQVGLLFTTQDSASLKEAITRFVSLKPEEIKLLKENCRRFGDEFSIDKFAEKCLELYGSLLGKSGESHPHTKEQEPSPIS